MAGRVDAGRMAFVPRTKKPGVLIEPGMMPNTPWPAAGVVGNLSTTVKALLDDKVTIEHVYN